MIVRGTADEWSVVWEAVVEEMAESTEKGVAIVFSVHEVETVCAVKMMQVSRGVCVYVCGGVLVLPLCSGRGCW